MRARASAEAAVRELRARLNAKLAARVAALCARVGRSRPVVDEDRRGALAESSGRGPGRRSASRKGKN